MADNDSVQILNFQISSTATDLLLSKIKPEESDSSPRVVPSRTKPVFFPRQTPGLGMNSQTGVPVPSTPRISNCYIPSRQNPIRMPSGHLPGVGPEGFPVVSHLGCPAGLLLPEAISRTAAAYNVFTSSALHNPVIGGGAVVPPRTVPTCADRLPVDLSINSSRSTTNRTEGSSPSIQPCKPSTPQAINAVVNVATTATNGLPTAFTPIACRTSLPPPRPGQRVVKNLSSAASVLEKVRLKALPDLSSALQLDPSVVLGDNQSQNCTPPCLAAPAATNGSVAAEPVEATPLTVASKEHKSRKGLHVCLYCDRTFSSASLFASHVKRPVARVVYRCHLCSLSPGGGGMSRDTVVVPAVNPDARGGMLSASNLCALYVHMAICHASEPVSSWRLVPSRLSVCALSSAAWEEQAPPQPALPPSRSASAAGMNATSSSHRSDEATPQQQTAGWDSAAAAATTEETVLNAAAPTASRPIVIDLEEGSDEECEELRLRHQQQNAFPIYSPGQELTDVWNDVERSVWALLPFTECAFLPPISGFRSALRQPDVPLMALSAINGRLDSLRPPPTPAAAATALPWPDTPQAHHLLRLAESPVWQGQYFLCGWDSKPSASNVSNDASQPCRILRPPAPSTQLLLSALKALNCTLAQKTSSEASLPTLPSSSTSSSSSTVPARTDSPAEVSAVLPSKSVSLVDRWMSLLCPRDTNPSDGSVNALRCLICDFRTNNVTELAHHFSGPPAGSVSSTPTRCALCSQSVACNQATASFCSMKAHLLFHLGIFLTCPQCGFTPPPTLTPHLAELCLRLHLRFVCFHFNVVQKYLCSWPECWKKTFTSLQNFIKHWLEVHTPSRFACVLCLRINSNKDANRDSEGKLGVTGDHLVNGNTNGPTTNGTRTLEAAARISGRTPVTGAFKFVDECGVFKHLRTEHQIPEQQLTSNPKDFCIVGRACSHCSLVCSSTVDLANHFTATHCRLGCSGSGSTNAAADGSTSAGPQPCESQCYFCCFNGCRKVFANAEELRQHLTFCPEAYRDLTVTFGRALNCPILQPPAPTNEAHAAPSPSPVPVTNEETTVAVLAAPAPASEDIDQKPNPLCFCLYCGVGVGKRNRPGPGNPKQRLFQQEPSDQQADQSDHADVPAAAAPLHLEANTPEDSRPASCGNSSTEVLSASPASAPSVVTLPVPVNCASTFFPSLSSLHAHERGHISYGGTGQIGCPWCGERLAYSRFEDIQNILDHLFTHTSDNRYVLWYLNRQKLRNDHPEEFLQCHCGAALDCPLAVCAHATQLPDRLLVDCPLTAHLRPACEAASARERASQQVDEAGRLARSPAAVTAAGRKLETASGGGGGAGVVPKPAPDLCCRNSVIRSPLLPGPHAPISARVLEHLRFAVKPQLDPLMSAFVAGSRTAFRCPICLSVEPTRWLLTEHAFTCHWTRLCYVCCRHEHQNSEEPPATADSDYRPFSFDDQQQAPAADAPGDSSDGSPHGSSSTVPVQSLPPKSRRRTTDTTDFWQHVFDCMLSRHLALLKADSASTEVVATADLCEAPNEADAVTKETLAAGTDQDMEGVETDEEEEEDEIMESDQGEANVTANPELPSSPSTSARSFPERNEVPEPPSRGPPASSSSTNPDRASVRSSCAVSSRLTVAASPALVSPTVASSSSAAPPTLPSLSTTPPTKSSALPPTPCETSQPPKMPRLEPSVTPVIKTSPTTGSVPSLSPQVPPPTTCTASTMPPSNSRVASSISVPNGEETTSTRVCIICGAKCTWDTYEEHMLEHRSPLLDWHGGPPQDPPRNNVPRRAIYRCDICERRFLQRASCARHMQFFHKVDRTALNWDDLVETLGSGPLPNTLPPTARLPTFAARMPFELPPQQTAAAAATPSSGPAWNGAAAASAGPPLLSCAFCSAQFKSRKQLKQHVQVTHPSPDGSLWLFCPDCGMQFLSKKSLNIHTRGTHHRSLLVAEDGLQSEVPELL